MGCLLNFIIEIVISETQNQDKILKVLFTLREWLESLHCFFVSILSSSPRISATAISPTQTF